MKFVTVATEKGGYFKWLELSCQRFNIHLEVLGYGQKWKGFTWRCHLLYDYLQTQKDDEIICFIDAYDVIILRNPIQMEAMFKKLIKSSNKKIILAEYKSTSLLHKIGMNISFGQHKGCDINAGTYIATAKYMKNMINTMIKMSNNNPSADDQYLLTRYANKNIQDISIDINSDFFLTTYPDHHNIKIKDNKLYYNDKLPFILHCPGNDKMDDIIKALGYDIDNNEISKLNKFHTQSFIKKLQHYIFRNKIFKILIIIFFIVILYFLLNKKK